MLTVDMNVSAPVFQGTTYVQHTDPRGYALRRITNKLGDRGVYFRDQAFPGQINPAWVEAAVGETVNAAQAAAMREWCDMENERAMLAGEEPVLPSIAGPTPSKYVHITDDRGNVRSYARGAVCVVGTTLRIVGETEED